MESVSTNPQSGSDSRELSAMGLPLSGGTAPVGDGFAACLAPPRTPGFIGRIGDYDVLRLCGSGGMGCVFLGVSSRSSGGESAALYAIKVLRPDLAANARARSFFLKESRHLQCLSHPHILSPIEVQSEGFSPYLVFPFLKNGSLADRLAAGGAVGVDYAVKWISQIVSALEHAHGLGVIHRDIKPANVLIDESGDARLVDFGLACTVFNDSMLVGARTGGDGTPPYFSPERARGEAGDSRCDIYAAGCLLYELLAGHPPYAGRSSQEIVNKIASWPPSPIASLKPETPRQLVRIIEKAMARDLRKRYAHARYLKEDLQAFVAEAKSEPKPPARASFRKALLLVCAIVIGGSLPLLFVRLRNNVGVDNGARIPTSRVQARAAARLKLVQQIQHAPVEFNQRLFRCDFNNDQTEDLWFFSGHKIQVLDPNGYGLANFQLNIESTVEPRLHRVVSDPNSVEPLLLFAWNQAGDSVISIRNSHLHERFRYALSGHAQFASDGSPESQYDTVIPQDIIDPDGSGRPCLLATASSGFTGLERSISLIDLGSGHVRWKYETAPFINVTASADLDGDGKLEVIATGSAVSNETAGFDGTTDSESWLFVFSAEGKVLLKQPVGGPLTYAYPWVSPGRDGDRSFYLSIQRAALQFGEDQYGAVGQIWKMNLEGQILARFDFGTELMSIRVVRCPEGDRIVASDRNGRVVLLDSMLSLIGDHRFGTASLERMEMKIGEPGDLDGDGVMEIPVIGFQTRVLSAPNMGRNSEPRVGVSMRWPTLYLLSAANLEVLSQVSLGQHWGADPASSTVILPRSSASSGAVAVMHHSLDLYRLAD